MLMKIHLPRAPIVQGFINLHNGTKHANNQYYFMTFKKKINTEHAG